MPLPDQFLAHIAKVPGLQAESFIEVHSGNAPAPVSVRRHPRKGMSVFEGRPAVAWHPAGIYLSERPDFTLDPLFHAGAYYVQEASSMSIVQALDAAFGAEREIRVLDLCGAPGGKSTLIAEWLDGKGLLVTNEVIRSRASVLKENIDRWGYANVVVSNNDPRQFSKLEGFFDAIVVDAPCSGSGMFRKDPDTQQHWSLEAVEHCSLRQKRILEDVWPALREDGILIYSTCSYSEAEDEAQVKALIDANSAEFIPIPELKQISGIVHTDYGYRFYPNKIQGEGFFLAVLKKTDHTAQKDLKLKLGNKVLSGILSEWIEDAEAFAVVESHLGASLFPVEQLTPLALLLKQLHILKCGTLAGEFKGARFLPDHELALSVHLNVEVPGLSLSKDEALHFLKKESLKNPYMATGTQLMRYNDLGLGWGNALPNRINNGLPKSWRIRKELE